MALANTSIFIIRYKYYNDKLIEIKLSKGKPVGDGVVWPQRYFQEAKKDIESNNDIDNFHSPTTPPKSNRSNSNKENSLNNTNIGIN
jgi:hypothetical protein